jgi:LPXTG-motif cell wall-anchored protein
LVSITFTVPANLEPGHHTVILAGLTSGLTLSTGLTVTAVSAALADTGAPAGGLVLLGLALLAGGVGALCASRRRLSHPRRHH